MLSLALMYAVSAFAALTGSSKPTTSAVAPSARSANCGLPARVAASRSSVFFTTSISAPAARSCRRSSICFGIDTPW